MPTHTQAAILGAFAADALSLGVHWVYNTAVIDKKLGRVTSYHDPMTSYHKGKTAGDFTHYGDQMLVLLESLQANGAFDAQAFAGSWQRFFADYPGYFDKATQATLKNMAAGNPLTDSGSDSDDLAGAARMAPLLGWYGRDPKQLVGAARQQTAITHTDERVVESAGFFARVVAAVLDGQTPEAALRASLDGDFGASPIAPLIRKGLARDKAESRETIAEFGQACSVEEGLPAAVHLIVRHQESYETAMVENVMAGGDSSARGMLVGMVLGAAHGSKAIPKPWINEMKAVTRIQALLGSR